MTMKKDTLIALGLVAFNAVYLSQIFNLPTPFKNGEPGPAFLPIILSAVLFLSSFAILFQSLKADGEEEGESAVGYAKPILIIAATAVFIALLHYLGYWIATIFYTFSVALTFEYRAEKQTSKTLAFCAFLAVVITGFGWLFFVKLFNLSLPTGVF